MRFYELENEERKEVYRILKELTRNFLKYAPSSYIPIMPLLANMILSGARLYLPWTCMGEYPVVD